MIEFEGVAKTYSGKRVIDDVSFAVGKGQVCALIGSSGSGKSTLLRMVNRLTPLSAGLIRVGGEDISTLPATALRRRIGYVIQSIGLFPHWTVEDNIATVPRLLNWPAPRVQARVRELLELLHLDVAAFSRRFPHELSGGQQQRVGVARALAADPDVLLMDEPFGALDPITRGALQAEFVRIHATTQKTILLVTHDLDEALRLADTLAVLDHGRIVQFGSPRDIIEQPATDFVRDLIGPAEVGLKRLAVRRVAEILRPGETARGEPIADAASLKDALSQMLAQGVDRLPVSDRDGRVAGSIRLTEIVRLP